MAARSTSLKVYLQIESEGLLSRMRWLVYAWLYTYGPATGREVNKGLTIPHAHVRLHELQQQGVVMETGTKTCSVSGRESISWDVTSNLPSTFVPVKRKSKEEIDLELQDAETEIARLRDLLARALGKMEAAGLFS